MQQRAGAYADIIAKTCLRTDHGAGGNLAT
jgi:hypothetical protein